MSRLFSKVKALATRSRARIAGVGLGLAVASMALLPGSAMAEEGAGTSGAGIAKDFVEPLTSKFTEALPIVIGFLVLVSATGAIIAFAVSRGRSKKV